MRKVLIVIIVLLNIFGLSANTQLRPVIKNGVLDLRGNKLEDYGEIDFSGVWEFYWEELLYDSDFRNDSNLDITAYASVPAVWNNLIVDGEKLSSHGYGTYRIKVLVDNNIQPLAIKFGSMSSAFRAFVDDDLVKQGGVVATNREEGKPGFSTGLVIFQPPSNSFNIIIQISNYHYCKGGLWNDISTIGKAEIIQESWGKRIELLLLLLGSILIIGIYHIGLFQLNKFFKSALYFALFCFIIGVRAISINEIYILKLIPTFNWNLLIKLEYLSLTGGAIVFVLFIEEVLPKYTSKVFASIVFVINMCAVAIVLFTSVNTFTKLLYFSQSALLLAIVYSMYVTFKALIDKQRVAQFLSIGLLVLVVTIINDIMYVNRVVETTYLTTYGFMFFIVSQAYMLSYRFQKMYSEKKDLALNLEKINLNLENTVIERTKEIKTQNTKLVEQNEEITTQRDNIEGQNQILQIQKQVITDSLNYAQRIQKAVMPSENVFLGHLKDHFILYKPRDIVSGDFYWFTTKGNKLVIVVADCTGHGVPGAFMSMLGMAFLAEISQMTEVKDPAQILEFLREKVKQSLHQFDEQSLQREGMDMAICIYDPKTNFIEFSGAYSPLYIVRNNEIIVHKGDRQPVAIFLREKQFTNLKIKVEPEDRFYMFSDGYADQTKGHSTDKFMVKKFKSLLLSVHLLPMQEQKTILETHT